MSAPPGRVPFLVPADSRTWSDVRLVRTCLVGVLELDGQREPDVDPVATSAGGSPQVAVEQLVETLHPRRTGEPARQVSDEVLSSAALQATLSRQQLVDRCEVDEVACE